MVRQTHSRVHITHEVTCQRHRAATPRQNPHSASAPRQPPAGGGTVQCGGQTCSSPHGEAASPPPPPPPRRRLRRPKRGGNRSATKARKRRAQPLVCGRAQGNSDAAAGGQSLRSGCPRTARPPAQTYAISGIPEQAQNLTSRGPHGTIGPSKARSGTVADMPRRCRSKTASRSPTPSEPSSGPVAVPRGGGRQKTPRTPTPCAPSSGPGAVPRGGGCQKTPRTPPRSAPSTEPGAVPRGGGRQKKPRTPPRNAPSSEPGAVPRGGGRQKTPRSAVDCDILHPEAR